VACWRRGGLAQCVALVPRHPLTSCLYYPPALSLTAEAAKKGSRSVVAKYALRRKADMKIDPKVVEQFGTGRLLAVISSRPGQSGRADGYVLEGQELEFYSRKIQGEPPLSQPAGESGERRERAGMVRATSVGLASMVMHSPPTTTPTSLPSYTPPPFQPASPARPSKPPAAASRGRTRDLGVESRASATR
jgi:hypothetical protein